MNIYRLGIPILRGAKKLNILDDNHSYLLDFSIKKNFR